MSKLSFRARALDATKSMPIFRKDEVSDLPDYSVLNRAVPQMPTGMEKEEESEHHLQRAISAQQVYGDKKVMVIPVPEAEVGVDYYNNVYKKTFRVPKQYIHNQAQALNSIMEQEKPDYDMDSEDERWVRDTNKRTGLEISDLQFEEMIDRLEKSCGNQVVTLQEAKLLLKEDDDLIKAVYEYWLQKRIKKTGNLNFQVRQEKRDGSSSGDSYVAFRRRTEKMQTRKNRKNDEASYEKMLKLRRDLSRAVTILEMIKRREKGKRELLHLTLEIAEKRYQMKDWDGKGFKMAKREVAAGPGGTKFPVRNKNATGNRSAAGIHPAVAVKHKLKYELNRENRIKKKSTNKRHKYDKIHLHPSSQSGHNLTSPAVSLHAASGLKKTSALLTTTSVNLKVAPSSNLNLKTTLSGTENAYPHPTPPTGALAATPRSPGSAAGYTYQQAIKVFNQYEFTSSDDERPKSPLSGSLAPEDERKKNPDGLFAFRRKPGCKYNAPLDDLSGDHWPWMADSRHRYSLTTLTVPEKCMGFCRRRMGRGGRMLVDRAYSKWDKQLSEIDLNPEADYLPHKPDLQVLLEEIKHGRWRRYRPYDPLTHKIRKLTTNDNQGSAGIEVKSFGHSSASPVVKQQQFTKEIKQQIDSSQPSSDSETVDIMTTDESTRRELHKRLLHGSPHAKSSHYTSQKNRTTPQKRSLLVRGKSLVDKSSAVFAVSALMSSPSKQKVGQLTADSLPTQKSKVQRVHTPLKLNVVSGSSSTLTNTLPSRSAPVAMTLIGNLSGTSPGRYVSSTGATMHFADGSTPQKTTKSKPGKFTLDHTKYFGVKSQDVVQAALMSVSGLHSNSSTANSVTFTLSGATPKASLTTSYGSVNAPGVLSLSVAQPSTTNSNYKTSVQNSNDGMQAVRSSNIPVSIVATLRYSNQVSSAGLHGAMITNGPTQPSLSTSYTVNNQTASSGESPSTIGTVIITPSPRLQYTKAGVSEQTYGAGSVPLTFQGPIVSTSSKQHQQSLLLGPNLNLAITPASPQKHSFSQLSIPHTSGHSPAVLIATSAGGSHVSSLPSNSASGAESGTSTVVGGGGVNLNHTKTVSINVARVQSSSSNVGQIFTLQQHPDANTGSMMSTSQTTSSQHSTSTWVTSGSGPNILKLGTATMGTGIQIHPVVQQKSAGLKQDSGFFKMSGNKSVTVISKRMRNIPQGNATRTISIANTKPQGATINNSKTSVPSSHITLLPDGRNNLTKPLISIGHPQKNNTTVVLATKGIPSLDQSCLIAGDSEPTQINIQNDNVVGDAGNVLTNKTAKSNQPMEVT